MAMAKGKYAPERRQLAYGSVKGLVRELWLSALTVTMNQSDPIRGLSNAGWRQRT